jgi:hypothetical protein
VSKNGAIVSRNHDMICGLLSNKNMMMLIEGDEKNVNQLGKVGGDTFFPLTVSFVNKTIDDAFKSGGD